LLLTAGCSRGMIRVGMRAFRGQYEIGKTEGANEKQAADPFWKMTRVWLIQPANSGLAGVSTRRSCPRLELASSIQHTRTYHLAREFAARAFPAADPPFLPSDLSLNRLPSFPRFRADDFPPILVALPRSPRSNTLSRYHSYSSPSSSSTRPSVSSA
jgi:hypothetical protein